MVTIAVDDNQNKRWLTAAAGVLCRSQVSPCFLHTLVYNNINDQKCAGWVWFSSSSWDLYSVRWGGFTGRVWWSRFCLNILSGADLRCEVQWGSPGFNLLIAHLSIKNSLDFTPVLDNSVLFGRASSQVCFCFFAFFLRTSFWEMLSNSSFFVGFLLPGAVNPFVELSHLSLVLFGPT